MLSRLSKMAPSILTFKANAVPTISIEGNIDYNTYYVSYLAPIMSKICLRRYLKINRLSAFWLIPQVAAMLRLI